MHEPLFFKNLGRDMPVLIVNGTKGFADPSFFYFSAIKFGVFEASSMLVKKDGSIVISNGLDSEAAVHAGCNVKVFSSRENMLEMIKKGTGGAQGR